MSDKNTNDTKNNIGNVFVQILPKGLQNLRKYLHTDFCKESLNKSHKKLWQILVVALLWAFGTHALALQNLATNTKAKDFSLEQAKEMRLVVLDPASIEIIYLLGKQDSIKAIATMQQSHIYPQEHTSKLPSVGSFSNPSVEKILSFKPTLVILSLYSLGLKERLENLGIQTAYLQADRLEDMYENIAKIATLLGEEAKGAQLIDKTKSEIKSLQATQQNQKPQKSVIFLYSSNPLMAFNDNSVIADILRLLGLQNKTIATNVARPILSNEFLLKADPDILILGVQANDISTLIAQNPALKNLKAYKNNAIFTYPKAHRLLRVSPTIVDGIKDLKATLDSATK